MGETSRTRAVQLLALFAAFVVADSKLAGKPASSYFNICARGESNELNECVKNTIIGLRPQLMKGIPALGVMPLEPLVIPKIDFNDGGSFSLDTTMSNLNLRGVGDYVLNSVNIKLENDSLMVNISFDVPDLKIVGDYQMDGKLLTLPISGKGNFEMNLTAVAADVSFVSKAVSRHGKHYFDVEDTQCVLTLNGVARSRFYNLFNGQKVLGDATNAFLNDNYKEISEVVKQLPEGAFAKIYKEIISKIFHHYPVDDLFAE